MNRKKKTEKISKEALLIIIFIITTLLIVATGCHNKCTHETVDWEDSDEWHEMWYNKLDTNSNGEVDTEEYHGKEGKSEYGEYEYNKWMEMQ